MSCFGLITSFFTWVAGFAFAFAFVLFGGGSGASSDAAGCGAGSVDEPAGLLLVLPVSLFAVSCVVSSGVPVISNGFLELARRGGPSGLFVSWRVPFLLDDLLDVFLSLAVGLGVPINTISSPLTVLALALAVGLVAADCDLFCCVFTSIG